MSVVSDKEKALNDIVRVIAQYVPQTPQEVTFQQLLFDVLREHKIPFENG